MPTMPRPTTMTWIRSLPLVPSASPFSTAAAESLGRTEGARGCRTVGACTERERERWMRDRDCEAARPGRATVGERSRRLSIVEPFIGEPFIAEPFIVEPFMVS